MRTFTLAILLPTLLLCGPDALAQTVVHYDEDLAPDRPEAWAMNYVTASTLMTGWGELPTLAPGALAISAELGNVPRLSDAQQRVGFNGNKPEELNKSPVFGRAGLLLGLPGAWVAELGYTPPLAISGAQPRDLFALAIGRRLVERGRFGLSLRLVGQHGRARGDITCPARLAGIADRQLNPYGCQAPSDDQIALNYYGAELTSGWAHGPWHAHASLGAVRTELAVQVNALTYGVNDRSRLTARGVMRFITLGVSHDLGEQWKLGMEVLHVPMQVRRGFDASVENEPMTSMQLQLRYRID